MPDFKASLANARNINLAVLVLACCWMLFFPVKKEMWYDESVSVLCAKGISNLTPNQLATNTVLTSADIQKLNTPANVYTATIIDNGNSYLYNILLHWHIAISGNSMGSYVLLSKLCGIGTLIVFYLFCGLLLGDSFIISLAMLLLFADVNYWGMSHEIRAYEMGTFFTMLSAFFFYKFMYIKERPLMLLLTGLFAVAAVLSHYLSAYVILVLLAYLVANKRLKLLKPANIIAIAIPVLLVGVYLYMGMEAFKLMKGQNERITATHANEGFNLAEVFIRSMKFTANNFKAVFPSFKNNPAIAAGSFLLVVGTFVLALRARLFAVEKRNLILLFVLGISSTFFLAALSVKSHHYTALYNRYYSFALPFSSLFIAYALKMLLENRKVNMVLKGVLTLVFVVPSVALYFIHLAGAGKQVVKYNHNRIASKIERGHITRVGVPNWSEALLVQCFLPDAVQVTYEQVAEGNNFVLYGTNEPEQIPVIRNER